MIQIVKNPRVNEGKPCYKAYGQYWPSVPIIKDDRAARLAIELEAFRVGLSVEDGGLGKFQHFRNICEWLFPSFTWNRWAVRAAKAMCENRYVGLTGCASSGKTTVMVLYALVCYVADMAGTLIFVVTTSKTDAETRIWAEFKKRHSEMRAGGLEVTRLRDRPQAQIIPDKPLKDVEGASMIILVAAGDKDRDNAVQKLQGSKNRNVILLADEFQDCSNSVMDATVNLRKNPNFQMVCSGNAASYFDAHGIFCTPIDGWGSITVEFASWPIKVGTHLGICIHFDGKDSPNFDRYHELGGKNEFPHLLTVEAYNEDEETLGPKSPKYWRQARGFWTSESLDDSIIYPAPDLAKFGAMERNIVWKHTPISLMAIDPSYTNGGDKFVCYHVEFGMTARELPVINFKEYRELKVEGSDAEDSRNYKMVAKCEALAKEWGIIPSNVALDGSSKNPIGDIFRREWSPEILIVDFNGSPSDLPYIDNKITKKAKDVFDRRVSEIWYVGRQLLENNQLAGIHPDHALEMSIRRYKEEKKKIIVETKKEMKERTGGKSPDIADAGFVAIDLLRQRHKLVAGRPGERRNSWVDLFGPAQNKVDRPPTYTFKSLHTMQRTARPENGSLGSSFGRRN